MIDLHSVKMHIILINYRLSAAEHQRRSRIAMCILSYAYFLTYLVAESRDPDVSLCYRFANRFCPHPAHIY